MEDRMLLTDDEMKIVRDSVERQAGFDEELIKRCSSLIHIKAFDEAVRNAFVLLEEKMRKALNKENATGYQMVQFAFSANGPFTKLLSHDQLEYEGTRDLFAGAFRLYRNPAAHTIVGYSAGEARGIISLVDLLIKRLEKLGSMPQIGSLPGSMETILADVQKGIGLPATNRIRLFLHECLKTDIPARSSAKQWIPFRKYALVKHDHWDTPKSHPIAIFYLMATGGLWFPVNQYYNQIVGLDTQHIISDLKQLGFKSTGKYQDLFISFTTHNQQAFFDNLLVLIKRIAQNFEATITGNSLSK